MPYRGDRQFYVYVLTNATRRLYVGVTNDLQRRMYEHKHSITPGFTAKYKISWLVHFEQTPSNESAIAREKQIKGWGRDKKFALIESSNPQWRDLSQEWFPDP